MQTIAALTRALGYTFDTVFRKSAESSLAQPWQAQATLTLEMRDESDLVEWRRRKTMKPMASHFSGAQEVLLTGAQVDSSNHAYMHQAMAHAAESLTAFRAQV